MLAHEFSTVTRCETKRSVIYASDKEALTRFQLECNLANARKGVMSCGMRANGALRDRPSSPSMSKDRCGIDRDVIADQRLVVVGVVEVC
jgi:hypothetical protein